MTTTTQGRNRTIPTASVLKRPYITEKAVNGMNNGVYCFEVDPRANKFEIKKAVESVYKFTPVKVHVVVSKTQTVRSRKSGKLGTASGGKKAYVYLKKGDVISVY